MPELEAAAVAVETAPVSETAVEQPEVTTGAPETGAETTEAPEVAAKPETKGLTPEIRKLIEATKATDPKLAGQIKDLFFANEAFKREFPGGMQQVRNLKSIFEEFGGEEGIASLKQEKSEWQALDENFTTANPQFIDAIAAENPEAFSKLLPHAINKFGQLDPQGYQRHMSGIVLATLNQSGLVNQLYRVNLALGAKNYDEAGRLLSEIDPWVKSLEEISTAKPEEKRPDDAQQALDNQRKELDQREGRIFVENIGQEYDSWSKNLILSEWKAYTKGKVIDPEREEMFLQQTMTKVVQKLKADKSYEETGRKFFGKRDRDGFLKHAKSRSEPIIKEAAKNAYRVIFGSATLGAQAKPAVRAAAAPAAQAGFVKVAAPPSPQDIDLARSPFEMRYAKKAILKNGQKVQWD